MRKRTLSFLLVLMLLLVTLALPTGAAMAGDGGYNGVDNLKVYDEMTDMTVFFAYGTNGAPDGDMPIWLKAAEITNVKIVNVANPSISEDNQSFATLLAGGKLPDIIRGQYTNLRPIAGQGGFIPLGDLIEQYGPNIQRYLSEYPEAVAAGTGANGEFYYIGGTLGGISGQYLPSMGWFIRQDWLDKLGLETPTTFEEFEAVMYAFRNDDPNGNGEKDEIPFLFRDKGIHTLLPLFGVPSYWNGDYIDVEDGNIYSAMMSPAYKDALIHLAQWYADGIIDPEIFTRGSQARQELFGNNVGGCTMDWFASTGGMNDNPDIRTNVPDFDLEPMLPPANINGEVVQTYCRAPLHTYAWGISKDCADPVAAIRFMDFWLSEEGSLLNGYGIEGEDYIIVDGQIQITDTARYAPETYPVYMRSRGSYEIGAGSSANINSEMSSMNEQALKGFQMYLDKPEIFYKPVPELSYAEDEQDTLDRILAEITPYIEEYQQQCIMGVKDPATSFDEYVANLKAMGAEEAIQIKNDAYVRYQELMQLQ